MPSRESYVVSRESYVVIGRGEDGHLLGKAPNLGIASAYDGRVTRVPFHGARDLGRGTVRKIIRDAGVSRQQFMDALGNA